MVYPSFLDPPRFVGDDLGPVGTSLMPSSWVRYFLLSHELYRLMSNTQVSPAAELLSCSCSLPKCCCSAQLHTHHKLPLLTWLCNGPSNVRQHQMPCKLPFPSSWTFPSPRTSVYRGILLLWRGPAEGRLAEEVAQAMQHWLSKQLCLPAGAISFGRHNNGHLIPVTHVEMVHRCSALPVRALAIPAQLYR